jgi:cell division protein FtsQ
MKLGINIPKKWMWLGTIGAFAIMLIVSIASRDHEIIDGITVNIKPTYQGQLLVNEKDILRTIELTYNSGVQGMLIKDVNSAELEKKILNNDQVANAEVYLDARNKLCVNIEQKDPIIKIQDKIGRYYLLDQNYKPFPASRHASPRLLIASGNIPAYDSTQVANGKHVLYHLGKIAQYFNTDVFANSVAEQLYVDEKGDILIVPKLGNQKYNIGNSDNIDLKSNKLLYYMKDVCSREGWTKHALINLKYENQLVCVKN